ncbi:MFS transporter [Mycena indigotica]|uniref:MFS transporter n=1 Tax=Mycena indigotica TaxID=2126181 RepID=A0A8H6VZA6_9AGAR|nr:MFS transporter [Mycena indigotica]KAF7297331.1 MFS transporter [Mycena indigotica]
MHNLNLTTSRETLDLAGDLDLEGQARRSATLIEESAFSSKDTTEKGKVEDLNPRLPATLAADDPENPRNWSSLRKITVNSILCTWVLTLTYSSTAYVASIPALINRFGISEEVALIGVTFTVLGFAAGPLLFGPASEIYGRQAVYRLCAVGYSGFSFGMAFSSNAASLLVFRFFVGFFGSASINNCPASIGDITNTQQRLTYTTFYALMAFGGPSLGPLVSAFIQHNAGFRWNLLVMAIFSCVISILVALVPETHGPTLLQWREQRRLGSSSPRIPFRAQITLFKRALARPIIYLFTEPVVALVSIYLSTLYGILYGFFEAFGIVYRDIRGFSATQYGLTYIALGLGFCCGCVLLWTAGQSLYERSARKDLARGELVRPEARLSLGYYGAIVSPISLFIFAWTAPFKHVHWIAPCIAEFLFSCSMLLIFTGFVPFLVDCYTLTAASALAAGMASRALVGSVFPLFALQMYRGMTVQGATCLLAGLASLLAPIPFIFLRWGTTLRAKSRHMHPS